MAKTTDKVTILIVQGEVFRMFPLKTAVYFWETASVDSSFIVILSLSKNLKHPLCKSHSSGSVSYILLSYKPWFLPYIWLLSKG